MLQKKIPRDHIPRLNTFVVYSRLGDQSWAALVKHRTSNSLTIALKIKKQSLGIVEATRLVTFIKC